MMVLKRRAMRGRHSHKNPKDRVMVTLYPRVFDDKTTPTTQPKKKLEKKKKVDFTFTQTRGNP
jgi:hypothetical protein